LNRSAVDTIKGYFYQFDFTIIKLLQLHNETDCVIIERIEDVDIKTNLEEMAIQCKYYSKTEYNHSVIANPVRLMLSHFIKNKRHGYISIKYLIYGHYKSGQHKLTLPLTVYFLKTNFLTYTKEKEKYCHHEELGASDLELQEFINQLSIDINAQEYSEQLNEIFFLLKSNFNCTAFEAENYYYNNALCLIKKASVNSEVGLRTLSRKQFLESIDKKQILFNTWFIAYKGEKKHFNGIRSEYFTELNSSPFDRIFLIEVDNAKYCRSELKEILILLSKKWSKISKREPTPFCPFIFIQGIDDVELIEIKKEIWSEGFCFSDGFDFLGSEFNPKSIHKKPTCENEIKLKFINHTEHIDKILKESTSTRIIYQFYIDAPYFDTKRVDTKHVKIQINELMNIKEII
jgi:hypothetical protein